MIKPGTYSLFLALFLATFTLFETSLFAKSFRIKNLGDDELTATILQNAEDPLIAGQVVCIVNKGQEINCGKIFRSNETEAVALFSEEGEKPLVGDEIIARRPARLGAPKKPANRAPTSDEPNDPESLLTPDPPQAAGTSPAPLLEEPESTFTESEMGEDGKVELENENIPGRSKKPAPEMATTQEDAERHKLIKYHRSLIRKYYGNEDFRRRSKKMASLSAGLAVFGESTGNNFWPMGLFQFATGKSSIFSLYGGYSTFGGSSVSATSYYLTLNYHYYPHDAFEGPTGRIGIGTGSLEYNALTNNQPTSGRTTPLVVIAATGYRFPLDRMFNIGIEAGVQAFQFSVSSFFNNGGTNTATSSSITFLMPVLLIDVGLSF